MREALVDEAGEHGGEVPRDRPHGAPVPELGRGGESARGPPRPVQESVVSRDFPEPELGEPGSGDAVADVRIRPADRDAPGEVRGEADEVLLTQRPASSSAQAVPDRPKCSPGRARGSRGTLRAIQSATVATASRKAGSGRASCTRVSTPRTPATPWWTLNGSVAAVNAAGLQSRPESSGPMVSSRCSVAWTIIRSTSAAPGLAGGT
ncbi:hypothetical protein AB0B89_32760 [Sphaerisporangium sp. NPDC049002]|uniref:hypothetical protein n=1 Tax=Sphaerisporangium sp. NPDC049002 TaxID=3155392 RepID=UPI003401724E